MEPTGGARIWTVEAFTGRRPAGAGDLSVETHGIAPIPEQDRYGRPGRMFTVWFAPQITMTGVFTGTLAITLGLGLWLGLAAVAIGTIIGSLPVAYLCTWGPRTGTAQLPNSRMAFGPLVVLPGVLQWLSSIAWDGLVGLFGGEALALLLGIPFWLAVLIVLSAQGIVGFFGYEVIHRVQAVLTVVLFATFLTLAIKLITGHQINTPATAEGADLAGSFVLMVSISLSLAISWSTYAADFSRYLPASTPPRRVFGFTFAGLVGAYLFVQGIGIAGASLLGNQTAEGVRTVMGGGLLGVIALLAITLASIGSSAMNDYSGSLALQTIGVRVRRPLSALVVTAAAFTLITWLHASDTATRFTDVLLLVDYWIPAFVAIVIIDWLPRIRGRATLDPTVEHTDRRDAIAAVVAFLAAYAASVPFMNTTLWHGPVAIAWHGADLAYFVNFAAAALLYGGWRVLGPTRA
ncbi:MAG: cytosine permease [Mycolicibacterium sp.]|nr:cytosine permease [Mycolicibacterium sp.]